MTKSRVGSRPHAASEASGAQARELNVLLELTGLPTAAGREEFVRGWVEKWVCARPNLRLRSDRDGNLLITRIPSPKGRRSRPIWFTAHMDHPAFVSRRRLGPHRVELEFRGGVRDAYFPHAPIELRNATGAWIPARIEKPVQGDFPYKRYVAFVGAGADGLDEGALGRWRYPREVPLPVVREGRLHAHACDDLAGVAAALTALDRLRTRPETGPVGVLLTRAEEVGFIGAIAACRNGIIPATARLICLEASRAYPESPIGGGPILRVGDRVSVFDPDLLYRIGELLDGYAKEAPAFRWQRKLMPGGVCEASVFGAHGYRSVCLCLALGHYHNMRDPDTARTEDRAAPEEVGLDDFRGLVDALCRIAGHLDDRNPLPLRSRLTRRFASGRRILIKSA